MRKFSVKMNNPALPFEVNGSGKFYKHLFVDSAINSWKVFTQEIQAVTARITGNAQIDGTLLIGGNLTINGTNSRLSSASGNINFDANNLTTIGNISAGNLNTTGGVTATGLAVNGTSSFAGAATFGSGLNASQISAGALSVSGTTTLNGAILNDSLTLLPFAGSGSGLIQYNATGTLSPLNFGTDTNAVLTGGGTFKNLGSMVAPYTGWQWYNSNVLMSTASVVAIENNLAIGGRVSIGAIRLSNGSATDTLATAREFALAAQKIFMRADTVIMPQQAEMKNIYSTSGTMGLQADTVRMSQVAAVQQITAVGVSADSMKAQEIASNRVRAARVDVAGDLNASGTLYGNDVNTNTITANNLTVNTQFTTPRIVTSRITSPDSVIHFGDSSIVLNIFSNSITATMGPNNGGLKGFGNLYIQNQTFPNPVPINFNTINNSILNPYVGNVGIGTSSPQAKLDVNGIALFSGNVGIGKTNPQAKLDVNGHIELVDHLIFDGTSTHGVINWPAGRNLHFRTNPTPGDVSTFTTRMIITGDGNVGIGTTCPDYKLDVNGTIRSEEWIIDEVDGCDFVFEKDYPLMPVRKRKDKILAQKHFFYIEPAWKMQQNGASMKTTAMGMLRILEEHEKYLWQYDERLDEMGKRLDAMEKKLKEKDEKLKRLEKENKKAKQKPEALEKR